MPMRPREAAKLEQHGPTAVLTSSGAAAFCADYFSGFWNTWPPAPHRTAEVRSVVLRHVSGCWHRAGLVDVSVFPLKQGFFGFFGVRNCALGSRRELRKQISDAIVKESGRGSSVVEQPIRNRQVVGSTPTLGSMIPKSCRRNRKRKS
jgi:hypothetical protein